MLKSALDGVVLTLAVLAISAVVLFESGYVPANADAPPGRLETWAASTSLGATLNREAPKEPDPVALTDENLLAGVRLFAPELGRLPREFKGTERIVGVVLRENTQMRELACSLGFSEDGNAASDSDEVRLVFALRPESGPAPIRSTHTDVVANAG
jgi:hypothetical protein